VVTSGVISFAGVVSSGASNGRREVPPGIHETVLNYRNAIKSTELETYGRAAQAVRRHMIEVDQRPNPDTTVHHDAYVWKEGDRKENP
jgi:hypothetical protein